MSHRQLYVIAVLLGIVGSGIFVYKLVVLGFPPAPESEIAVWTVQARFRIDADTGPVKAILQIPSDPPGFSILEEYFVSRGYGLRTQGDAEGREARWSIRDAEGPQTLYYRADVVSAPNADRVGRPPQGEEARPPYLEEPFATAVSSLAAEVRRRSADTPSLVAQLLEALNDSSPGEEVTLLLAGGRSKTRRAEIARTVLRSAGVPARITYGIELEDRQRRSVFDPGLEVWSGERWLYFDPDDGSEGLPQDLLIWWRGSRPLIRVLGAQNPEVEVSVQANIMEALAVAERRAELERSRLLEFSLFSLPVQTQAVYGVLLLLPVGALVMVLLRNVVGVKAFGTFMPVLVALAFRETELLWGIILFTGVVVLGLTLRAYLARLRLLVVPRLAAVLILVVLVMAAISVLSHKLGLDTGLSVALFPIVILTMAIERLSIVWEERGPMEALHEAVGSLMVAALCYLVMTNDYVEHLVFIFPEILLVVLAVVLLLGRYRGYRLLELLRFRVLGADQ